MNIKGKTLSKDILTVLFPKVNKELLEKIPNLTKEEIEKELNELLNISGRTSHEVRGLKW